MQFNPFSFGPHKLWSVGWGTYFTLRTWLMVLAFGLPLVFCWGGELFYELALQGSISAYYHAGHGVLRDVFVGLTIAVAALLIVYKGFSGFENWALNIGGGALVVVALVPDDRSTGISEALPWLHGVVAITFFACLVYVAFFRSGDTLGLMPDPDDRTRYQRFYWILGALMVLLVGLAALLAWRTDSVWIAFVVEAGGVWAFAIYWFFKTLEMRSSHADALAGRRLLRRRKYELRDVIRTLPIERVPEGSAEPLPPTS